MKKLVKRNYSQTESVETYGSCVLSCSCVCGCGCSYLFGNNSASKDGSASYVSSGNHDRHYSGTQSNK